MDIYSTGTRGGCSSDDPTVRHVHIHDIAIVHVQLGGKCLANHKSRKAGIVRGGVCRVQRSYCAWRRFLQRLQKDMRYTRRVRLKRVRPKRVKVVHREESRWLKKGDYCNKQ